MDRSMDVLVTALLDLSAELPELPAPMLIGGGFGLYLKASKDYAKSAIEHVGNASDPWSGRRLRALPPSAGHKGQRLDAVASRAGESPGLP